jgi:ribosomal protein L37AE/L43A
MSKPTECPKCKSNKVLRITYGLVVSDYVIEKDEFLGGCCVDDYEWHCGDCEWEWGNKVEGRYNKEESDID